MLSNIVELESNDCFEPLGEARVLKVVRCPALRTPSPCAFATSRPFFGIGRVVAERGQARSVRGTLCGALFRSERLCKSKLVGGFLGGFMKLSFYGMICFPLGGFTRRSFHASGPNSHSAFVLLKNQAPVVAAFTMEIDADC